MMEAKFLSPEVCTIEGFLTATECNALIARSEAGSYELASIMTGSGPAIAAGVRNNDRFVVDDPVLADELWARLGTAFSLEHEGYVAVGLNERLRFYRYGPGQKFDWHLDGSFARGDEASRFTLMVYLNEACLGGETLFRGLPEVGWPKKSDLGCKLSLPMGVEEDQRRMPSKLAVVPKTGMALVFQHGLDHKGATVEHGVKYVLRTDVMYRSGRS